MKLVEISNPGSGQAGAGATDGMVGVSLENWGSGRKMKLLRKVKTLRKNETFEGKNTLKTVQPKKYVNVLLSSFLMFG